MQRPIQTLSDVIESVHNQYLYKDNGRCTPHFFVILFDGILGHKAFAVCNGLMFALMLHLFCLNFAGRKENYFTVASIVMASMVILLPAFSYAMLWMSGACNYLWDAVFVLFFHYLLGKDIRKRWWGLLFLYGIIAGNTHEGIMIGLSVGYAVYYLSHFKELTAQRWVMLTGLAIGVAFLVFSPAAMNRAINPDISGGTTIFLEGWGAMVKFFFKTLVYSHITCLALLLMLYRRRVPTIFGTAVIVLLLFNSMVNAGLSTQYFGLELCSLIVVLQLLDISNINPRYVAVMTIVPLVILLSVLPLCLYNYTTFIVLDAQIKAEPSSKVDIFTNRGQTNLPYLSERFLLPFQLYDYLGDSQRQSWAYHAYHKQHISIYPIEIKKEILSGKIDHSGKRVTLYNYFVCEWADRDKTVKGTIHYTPSKLASIPLLNKFEQIQTMQSKVTRFEVITIAGKSYLVIPIPPLLSDRFSRVEFE